MPNNEKVMRGTHDASSASVLPTTQAHLITIPSIEAFDATERARWRSLPLSHTPSHAERCIYNVRIDGYILGHTARRAQATAMYCTAHPQMAIGRAVCDYLTNNPRGLITSINIQRRDTKRTRTQSTNTQKQ